MPRPDDQKFLEAALAAISRRVITKDARLLDLTRRKEGAGRGNVPFAILHPAGQFENRLTGPSGDTGLFPSEYAQCSLRSRSRGAGSA